METYQLDLRTAQQPDVVAIAVMVRDVVSQLSYYNEAARVAEIAKYNDSTLPHLIDDARNFIVVSEATGSLTGVLLAEEDDGLLWINWFLTTPQARHQGVGRALVEAAIAEARRRGIHKVWCDTRTENVASMSVLTKLGFERIARVDQHWYGQDFFLWERRVACA